eukprot:3865995-Pyramimonas_sp.AAC.1
MEKTSEPIDVAGRQAHPWREDGWWTEAALKVSTARGRGAGSGRQSPRARAGATGRSVCSTRAGITRIWTS